MIRCKFISKIYLMFFVFVFLNKLESQTEYDLHFKNLSNSFNNGVSLGNGMLGELIWLNENKLFIAIDRADLWDLRPNKELQKTNYQSLVLKTLNDNAFIENKNSSTPVKLPSSRICFDVSAFGKIESVDVKIGNAICNVKWNSGITLKTFVHSTLPVGWFKFENVSDTIKPTLLTPNYELKKGLDSIINLNKLGYSNGKVVSSNNKIVYFQIGAEGLVFEIVVEWVRKGKSIEGVWSICSNLNNNKTIDAESDAEQSLVKGFDLDFEIHKIWWKQYWEKSSISIPNNYLNLA